MNDTVVDPSQPAGPSAESAADMQLVQELVVEAQTKLDQFVKTSGYGDLDELGKAKYWGAELTRRFVRIWRDKDMPMEILCEGSLFEAVSAGLQCAEFPTDTELLADLSPEEAQEQYKQFCGQIPVRIVGIDQLIAPPRSLVLAQEQFVVVMTQNMAKSGFLQQFDRMLNLSNTIQQMKIPITLTENDIELLFKFHLLMQMEAQRQSRLAQQQAAAQEVQLNKPVSDSSVKLFTP